MSDPRWDRQWDLFFAARERPEPERGAFVAAAAGEDAEMARAVLDPIVGKRAQHSLEVKRRELWRRRVGVAIQRERAKSTRGAFRIHSPDEARDRALGIREGASFVPTPHPHRDHERREGERRADAGRERAVTRDDERTEDDEGRQPDRDPPPRRPDRLGPGLHQRSERVEPHAKRR